MIKNIVIVLLLVVVAFAAYVATRPAEFHIERAATMRAAPEVVYAHIADFERWEAWSPWEELDPNMKKTLSGAESGVGAVYAWTGNNDVGEGRMTITDAVPAERVGIELAFLKPFKATNQTTFTLAPTAEGTSVTWAMDGRNNFVAKAMGVFMDMDQMIGNDFEKGLASLAQVAEADAAAADTAAAVTP